MNPTQKCNQLKVVYIKVNHQALELYVHVYQYHTWISVGIYR